MKEIIVRVAGSVPRPMRNVLRLVRDSIFACKRLFNRCLGRKVVLAFWADVLNFGDQITPALLHSYGVVPMLAKPSMPSNTLVSCGSILGWLEDGFSGYVLGAGLMTREEAKPMPFAHFLAVRGGLTREAMRLGREVLLGDPGLLSERLIDSKMKEKKILLGIVPHQIDLGGKTVCDFANDLQRQARTRGKVVKIISSRRLPRMVLEDIASCEYIVSSSLHGLIVADAFGVPSARIRFDKAIDDFKFADYYSAYNEDLSETHNVRRGINLDEVLGFCRFPEKRCIRIAQIKKELDMAYQKYIREVAK